MAERRPATTPGDPAGEAPDGRLRVEYDITVVDGEAGRRLAALQAEVILDVLTWLHDHPTSEPASHCGSQGASPPVTDPSPPLVTALIA